MRPIGMLAAVLMIAGAATGNAPDPAERVARCGHVVELEAAKQALERGDEAEALRHLEAADALLARCEREGIPEEPEVGKIQTGSASGAEAPLTPSAWRAS